MIINVRGHNRNVVIKERDSYKISGRVGTVAFVWNKKYKLPAINWYGRWTTNELHAQEWVRLFIEAYEAAMIAPKGKSPMHFDEYDPIIEAERAPIKSIVVKKEQHVSGVPLWMKEEHKVWTKCNRKDGSYYMRRTRYKEDSRDLVEEYLPTCSDCCDRDLCSKPCVLDVRQIS